MNPETGPHVLFVDDDVASTTALIRALERRKAPFQCHAVTNAVDALAKAAELCPHAAVIDLSLDPAAGPDSGLTLVETLIASEPTMRILVLTGHGSEQYGIRSLQTGAASFLQKPADPSHLLALLQDAVSYSRLKRSFQRLTPQPDSLYTVHGIWTKSPAMASVLETIAYAASTLQPVLLAGETGTGKGMLAQAIHQLSGRRAAPFIRFAPAFGSSDLVTSELFGHQRGAFTGAHENRRGLLEEAHTGTLFIDEVDELPHETQVMLLHVLQERVFRRLGTNKELHSDFRLLAATNRPLDSLVPQQMRADFFHRIAHIVIEVPPLRDRRDDIPGLAEEFLRAAVLKDKLAVQGLTSDAVAKLRQYSWPGNVRELRAVIENAALHAQYEHRRFIEGRDIVIRSAKLSRGGSFRECVRQFELRLVQEALVQCGNNQSRAARTLELDRSSLRKILERANRGRTRGG